MLSNRLWHFFLTDIPEMELEDQISSKTLLGENNEKHNDHYVDADQRLYSVCQ